MTELAKPAARSDLSGIALPITGSRALPSLLAVSLILTGTSALIYQVTWFRILGQVFGVTVQATAAVLAAFMAGLALGSLLAARLSARLGNALRFYGIAETVIGLSGLASLPAFDALQPLYANLGAGLGADNPVLAPLRFVLAFAIMLIPTTLMGATLPIVITATERRSPSLARNVSLLYGANTFGAIAGAFLAGFYLIGLTGMTTTVAVAATINLVIGLVWLALSFGPLSGDPSVTPGEPAKTAAIPDPELRLSHLAASVLLLAYGLSGGVALAAEVVWTRILAGIYPGTTYSFSIMLCCTLAGIAIGSWLINPLIARRGNWLVVFVVMELALALTALLSLITLGQAYTIEAWLRGLLGAQDILTTKPIFMAAFALLVIGPSALLMGLTFPVAAKLFAAGHRDPGRRVGLVYGANTIGAIAGPLLAGLVLIPMIGAQPAMWLLAAGNAVAAIAVLAASGVRLPVKLAISGGVAVLALVAVLATPDLYRSLYAANPRGESTVWYQEGQDATVRVADHPDGVRILYINSEHQGQNVGEGADFHHQIGHWGSLLHPNPRDVLVVGLGVGATPGAAALHPNSRIDLIELYPGVVDAGRFFPDVSYGVLDRPNVSARVTDGRNHLLLTGKSYDVVQTDPIRPYNAGAGNLYSADFYRLVRDHLNEGGLMVQWMDTSLPNYSYRILLRTFLSQFPDATLWHNGSIIVGSKGGQRLDDDALQRAMAQPEVAASLASFGLRTPADVQRELTAGPEAIAAYAGEGPVITDRTPWVEFFWTLPLASDSTTRPDGWSGGPTR